MKSFRQSDGLSYDLFNICMEAIIRMAKKSLSGTIFKKRHTSSSLCGWSDIITTVDALDDNADEMGLKVNATKPNHAFRSFKTSSLQVAHSTTKLYSWVMVLWHRQSLKVMRES